MANKGATVYLNHQEKTYKGEVYESFVGSLKVGNTEVLISINAENGKPKVFENEFKNKKGYVMYGNAYKIDPRKKDKKRNEL